MIDHILDIVDPVYRCETTGWLLDNFQRFHLLLSLFSLLLGGFIAWMKWKNSKDKTYELKTELDGLEGKIQELLQITLKQDKEKIESTYNVKIADVTKELEKVKEEERSNKEDLNLKIKKYQLDLTQKDKEVAKFKNELGEEQSKIKELQLSLVASKNEKEQATKTLESSRKALEKIEFEKKDLGKQIESLRKEKSAQSDQITKLQKESESLGGIQQKLDSSDEILGERAKEINSLKLLVNQSESARSENEKLTTRLSELESTVKTKEQELNEILRKLKTEENRYEEEAKKFSQKESDLKFRLDDKAGIHSKEVRELQIVYRHEIQKLERQLGEVGQENGRLKDQIDEVKQFLLKEKEIQGINLELDKEIKSSREEAIKLKSKIEQLTKEDKDKEEKILAIQKDKEKESAIKESLEGEYKQIKQHFEVLEKESYTAKEDKRTLDRELQLLNSKISEQRSELKNKLTTISELEKRNEKASKQSDKYKEEIASYQKKITTIQSKAQKELLVTKRKKVVNPVKPNTKKAKKFIRTRVSGKKDDFTEINGIGPVLDKKLKQLGYTTFAELSNLSKKQIEEVESNLSFQGRIQRDKWIEQAKKLG